MFWIGLLKVRASQSSGHRSLTNLVRPSQCVSWAFVCIWPVLNVKSFRVYDKYAFRSGSKKFLLNINKCFLYDRHTVNCVRDSPNYLKGMAPVPKWQRS